MSSNTMLKQAIIDANALREVALKNAEAIVVEKYSNQIKEAVDTMLEQEEEEMEMGGPMDAGGGGPLPPSRVGLTQAEPGSELGDQTSLAAADGERLCPCPEDGATVEIDFAGLQDMMKQLDVEDAEGGPPPVEGEDDLMPGPGPDAVEGEEEEDEELMLEIDDLLGENFFSDAVPEEEAEADEEGSEALAAIAEDSGTKEAEHYADDAASDAAHLAHTGGKHKKRLKRDMDYDETHIALAESKTKRE